MDKRPTGIIRTLPSLYGNESIGAKRYRRSIGLLEAGGIEAIYIALSAKPTVDVLHMYLLVEGQIQVRLNIAGYIPGEEAEIRCWDDTIRTPRFWAICTGPVSRPETPIKRRGFQGFRYTQELW